MEMDLNCDRLYLVLIEKKRSYTIDYKSMEHDNWEYKKTKNSFNFNMSKSHTNKEWMRGKAKHSEGIVTLLNTFKIIIYNKDCTGAWDTAVLGK